MSTYTDMTYFSTCANLKCTSFDLTLQYMAPCKQHGGWALTSWTFHLIVKELGGGFKCKHLPTTKNLILFVITIFKVWDSRKAFTVKLVVNAPCVDLSSRTSVLHFTLLQDPITISCITISHLFLTSSKEVESYIFAQSLPTWQEHSYWALATCSNYQSFPAPGPTVTWAADQEGVDSRCNR